MNEQTLRALLEHAADQEPPVSPIAHNALLLGKRLRRRRRALLACSAFAVSLAAAILLTVALSGATPGHSRLTRRPPSAHHRHACRRPLRPRNAISRESKQDCS